MQSRATCTRVMQDVSSKVNHQTRVNSSQVTETGMNPSYDKEHPRNLIPELCRVFYELRWVTGTGGGISIKSGNEIFVAPSGVQKERIQPEDLFVITTDEKDVSGPPPSKKLKKSACTPLFMNAYKLRDAGAVIHSHSMYSNLVTLINTGGEFCITQQEMIKGIRNDQDGTYLWMKKAMEEYPKCPAVLVRSHGIYVWGPSWQKAKAMCECLDYLFEVAVEMHKLGMNPAKPPVKNIDGEQKE
uniref:Probable methylthioribulose-1-phosphate dehydratase n=1 Tax=Saccoglossus kowalevskii TaxID=10224 RepID=A0ABM0GVN5_SACKO|nr:PREDICTED: methylthioribulose-1-phosphate dehydratase-like [Saccoglossus kowalevskii]